MSVAPWTLRSAVYIELLQRLWGTESSAKVSYASPATTQLHLQQQSTDLVKAVFWQCAASLTRPGSLAGASCLQVYTTAHGLLFILPTACCVPGRLHHNACSWYTPEQDGCSLSLCVLDEPSLAVCISPQPRLPPTCSKQGTESHTAGRSLTAAPRTQWKQQ